MISTKALFEIVRTNDYEKLSSIINNLTPEDLLKTSKKSTSIIPHAIEYRSIECFDILLDSNKFDFKKMKHYTNGFFTALEYYNLAPNQKNIYYVDKLIQKNYEFFDDDDINSNIIDMYNIFRNINLYELFFPILLNSINRNPIKYLKYTLYSIEVFKKLYSYCVNNDLLTTETTKVLISNIIDVNNYVLLRCIDEPYKIKPTILLDAIDKYNLEIIKYLINNGSNYISEKDKLLNKFVGSLTKNYYNINKEKFDIFMLLNDNYKFQNIEKIVDDLLILSKYQYLKNEAINIILCMALKLIIDYKSDTIKFNNLFTPLVNFNFNNINNDNTKKVFKSFFEELEILGFELPKGLEFIKALKIDKIELLYLKKLKKKH